MGGRFCSDSSGYNGEDIILIFGNVFASFYRLVPPGYGKAFGVEMENVTPTLKCPNTTESYGGSYRLKSGLITADELTLAGDTMGLGGDNYLNRGASNHYWSMSPFFFSSGFKGAGVSIFGKTFDSQGVERDFFVRPVINVSTDNGFTSGDGTAENPYVITAE